MAVASYEHYIIIILLRNTILSHPGKPTRFTIVQTPNFLRDDPSCNESVVLDSSCPLISPLLRHAFDVSRWHAVFLPLKRHGQKYCQQIKIILIPVISL